MRKQILVLSALLIAFSAFAKPSQKAARRYRKRTNQRIQQGVRSGELTKSEAKELRKDQRKINETKQAARADGVVTDTEKQEIRKMKEETSEKIYQEKHDAEKAPKAQ